jgi:hypothetical protein
MKIPFSWVLSFVTAAVCPLTYAQYISTYIFHNNTGKVASDLHLSVELSPGYRDDPPATSAPFANHDFNPSDNTLIFIGGTVQPTDTATITLESQFVSGTAFRLGLPITITQRYWTDADHKDIGPAETFPSWFYPRIIEDPYPPVGPDSTPYWNWDNPTPDPVPWNEFKFYFSRRGEDYFNPDGFLKDPTLQEISLPLFPSSGFIPSGGMTIPLQLDVERGSYYVIVGTLNSQDFRLGISLQPQSSVPDSLPWIYVLILLSGLFLTHYCLHSMRRTRGPLE